MQKLILYNALDFSQNLYFKLITEIQRNQMMMNLQSPTTLLTSIQFMRNRLRDDKQLLMDIKDDFTQVTRKQKKQNQNFVHVVPNQKDNNTADPKQAHSIDRPPKNKILELKKEHQKEILALKQLHQKQVADLIKANKQQILQMEKGWKAKVDQQANYICILQEQVQQMESPIQSERDKTSQEQYEKVINNLLRDNTRLHEMLQKAREQVNAWRNQCIQAQKSEAKNRFKFGKKKNLNNKSVYESQKCLQLQHKKTNSMYAFNDQNVDTSNFSIAERWEDQQIKDEEGGLRTIRQFQQISAQAQDIKSKYLSLNL